MLATAVGAVFRLGTRKSKFLNMLLADNTVERDEFFGNEACNGSKLRLRFAHKERVLELRYIDYYREG